MKYNETMTEEKLSQDRKHLKESFYKVYDHSKIHTFMSKLLESPNFGSELIIGEGTFFRVYALKSKSLPSPTPMTLSLSIAKPNFPPLQSKEGQKQWLVAISKLKSLYQEVSLIPPLEIISDVSGIALAMPYGEAPLDRASQHWQPISKHIELMLQKLSTHKLVIEDRIQGRSWQGIPFIFDFSDLKLQR